MLLAMKTGLAFIVSLFVAVASTRGDLINLDVEIDSFVRLGTANQNYGLEQNLPVKNSGGAGTTRHGYLRFDLSTLPLDAILDATLTLDMTGNNNGGNPLDPTPAAYTVTVFGLNDGHSGEDWIEGNGGTDGIPTMQEWAG